MTLAVRAAFVAIQVLVALPVLYLSALAAAAVAGRGRAHHSAEGAARTSFLAIVPAHDEELVLGRLLDSIAAAAYPRGLVEVLVAADNCTDRTATIAHLRGVRCWEREDARRQGKGYALDWAMRHASNEAVAFDAFVVLDADSEVEPRFFACLDREMRAAPGVLQAHYSVLNPRQTAFTAVTTLAFTLQQYVKPLGRTALGLSPRLLGNGMCFPAAMLAEGWKATSISEDLNHYVRLLLDGHRTRLVPDAEVRAEMPPNGRVARSQRVRWEKGKLLAIRERVPSLLRAAIRRRDPVLADAALDILLPPFSVLVAALTVVGTAGLAVPLLRTVFSLPAWAAEVALLGAYVATGAALARVKPAVLLASLAAAPAFVVWKLWIQAVAVLGVRDREWVRTARTAPADGQR